MDACSTTKAPILDKGKGVRDRWSWSKLEEEALISCLIDIVNDGWKAKNGFKKKMRKMLPGTGIVANPQINSKIHVWKKEYGALSDLLLKSGIGWNSTTSMIEVSDEDVWDSSRQADPHLKSDWATGENAVDPIDLFQELMNVDLEQVGETGDKYVPRTADILNEVDDNSICKPNDSGKRACSKGKKRKSVDADLSTKGII
ncbi:hypothetical protein ACS0TY_019071 [Phlomoides rotata]